MPDLQKATGDVGSTNKGFKFDRKHLLTIVLVGAGGLLVFLFLFGRKAGNASQQGNPYPKTSSQEPSSDVYGYLGGLQSAMGNIGQQFATGLAQIQNSEDKIAKQNKDILSGLADRGQDQLVTSYHGPGSTGETHIYNVDASGNLFQDFWSNTIGKWSHQLIGGGFKPGTKLFETQQMESSGSIGEHIWGYGPGGELRQAFYIPDVGWNLQGFGVRNPIAQSSGPTAHA